MGMSLNADQIAAIEAALQKLEVVDPAELPEPAAELADLLNRILDGMEPQE